jgi:hypothetical protein
MSLVTLVYSGRTVAIPRQAASALADELWKGSRPGSVTSAAKLAKAMASVGSGRRQPVRFDDYEASAIAAALDELGLANTDHRSERQSG